MTNEISLGTKKKIVGTIALVSPITFLVSMPWLKEQSETVVYTAAMIAATLTVIASLALAILKDNELDEWHRGAARFASQWGWLIGAGIVALAQGIPYIQGFIYGFISSFTEGETDARQAISFSFMAGFMTVVFMQMICTLALSKAWRSYMSREA